MKVLCVFGKHQYGDPSRGLGIEYVAFVPTLRRLGHDVIHFESWDHRVYSDFAQLNLCLLQTIERERPDVMFTVQCAYEIWLETLAEIWRRGDVATISWTTDDSWKYEQVSRFIGPFYHAMTTTYPGTVRRYHRDGIRNVMLTSWAANSVFLHAPVRAADCRIPVSFVGASHGNRARRVERLRRQGIDVACFGHGWPRGSVEADSIPAIMRNSIISLNFAKALGDNQLKARTFEVPGAGGFLLTERVQGLEKVYEIGQEIAVFKNDRDLIEKVRHFLNHPDNRDAIAKAGFERTRRDHTYEIRLSELLPFALEAKAKSPRLPPRLLPESFEECLKQHRFGISQRTLRRGLVMVCSAIWGRDRGPRAARSLLWKFSWRFLRAHTFRARGWPGRVFTNLS